MDFSGVHQTKSRGMKRGTRNRNKNNKKTSLVKVVYISSPMKVKTCASNFRALVQELTGRDSDMSRYTDFNTESSDGSRITDFNAEPSEISGQDDQVVASNLVNDDEANVFKPIRFDSLVVDPYRDSPTSSESLFEPFEEVFSSQMVEKLEEMFPSNLFNYESYTSHEIDVLGDYDVL